MVRKLCLVLLPVAALLFSTATGSAQAVTGFPPKKAPMALKPNPGKQPVVHHHYHVMYRQMTWKTKTFANHAAAHHFEQLMQSKGYVAHVHHHGNHFHVKYRFTQWKQFGVYSNHAQAHHIENSLQNQGFQAKVVHH
jgi:hypothetical protein